MNTTATVGRALRTLLRPLVRILLEHGVPLGVFMEHAKQVYVEIALRELAAPGRKPSVSRAAILTGLTRKEVSRLQGGRGAEADKAIHERYNRAARVLTGWIRDRRFLDKDGEPATLSLEGQTKSFSELVRRYSGDIPPRAMLDEMLRVGAVERVESGRLRLRERGFVPQSGAHEKLSILGVDAGDLMATIHHNLRHSGEEAHFQRKVAYDNLPLESLPALRDEARRRAQALLELLNERMAGQDRDLNPSAEGDGRARAVLGIYWREERLDTKEGRPD